MNTPSNSAVPVASPEAHIAEKMTESTPLVDAVRAALQRALGNQSKLPPEVLAMHGMSGQRYRHFINNLVGSVSGPRYLEIGCWAGSTMCAAIHGNRLRAFGIDNWSEFGGPSQHFLRQVAAHATMDVAFNMLTSDFRAVDYSRIGRFNLYLFDGPHTEADQYDGVRIALPALDDEFVLIVDDWNWPDVRAGTVKAVRDLGLQVLYGAEIRTTLDNTHPVVSHERSDWHNGYCISVLRKPQTPFTEII